MNPLSKLFFPLVMLVMAMVLPAQAGNVTDPDAPRSLPDDGRVAVQWTDPARFSDIKHSGNRWEARRGNWVHDLARHLRRTAERRLPAGDRLEVTLTDIDRAGDYEPGSHPQMQHVRILRAIYPPAVSLRFRHLDAHGNLVDEGERHLRDLDYLNRPPGANRTDSLRYEKRLIDDWLRREFGGGD